MTMVMVKEKAKGRGQEKLMWLMIQNAVKPVIGRGIGKRHVMGSERAQFSM